MTVVKFVRRDLPGAKAYGRGPRLLHFRPVIVLTVSSVEVSVEGVI